MPQSLSCEGRQSKGGGEVAREGAGQQHGWLAGSCSGRACETATCVRHGWEEVVVKLHLNPSQAVPGDAGTEMTLQLGCYWAML